VTSNVCRQTKEFKEYEDEQKEMFTEVIKLKKNAHKNKRKK